MVSHIPSQRDVKGLKGFNTIIQNITGYSWKKLTEIL